MTIYDIAKAAGVSASTVSRVINNKKGINEETRKRVQKLLDENNFTRSETARGLSMQSSKIIGILLEDIRIAHHTESIYVIEQEMTKHGYICITISTGPGVEDKVRGIKILEQRRVDGVILVGSMFAQPEVEEAIKVQLSNVPVVIVNGYLNLPNVYGVLIDEEEGVKECVAYLQKKGRRKIAYILDSKTPSNNSKLQGFLKGVKDVSGDTKPIVYEADNSDLNPEVTFEKGSDITAEIMKEHLDIDAIIYSGDLLAIGGMGYLVKQGIKVPEQVAVIGIDNTLYGKLCNPQLTSLNNKLVETSENAARILLDVLAKREVSHKIMLFTDIVERESS